MRRAVSDMIGVSGRIFLRAPHKKCNISYGGVKRLRDTRTHGLKRATETRTEGERDGRRPGGLLVRGAACERDTAAAGGKGGGGG